jgi:CPA2 family monovalent cation:H+ antiporter-2
MPVGVETRCRLTDNAEDSLKIAQPVRRHFPQLDIYATARDRFQALRLMDRGVNYFLRETFHSSLKCSEAVLWGLGDSSKRAMEPVSVFAAFDEELLKKQWAVSTTSPS